MMDSESQMQYLFNGYPNPRMNPRQTTLNAVNNSATRVLPSGMSLERRGTDDVTGSTRQSLSTHSQSLSSPITSHYSASLERDMRMRNTAYDFHSPRQGSDSSNPDMAANYQPYIPQLPTFSAPGGPWPAWRGGSVLSPFDIAPSTLDMPLGTDGPETHRSTHIPNNNDIAIAGESKRTAQRRVQRHRKKDFKVKSMQWPMKIACNQNGEPPKEVRLYVHAQFRATARKFLNFSVVHFRDHPDSDIKVVREDLDRRFLFDPPLREGYILGYIETSMRTSRYLWRKFWVTTGKGAKHRFCPARYFPALVTYWKTAAAEEESKRMKEARNAAKKKKAGRLAAREGDADESEDLWDVSERHYGFYM